MERARKTIERIIRDANGAADVVSRIRALFKRSTSTAGRKMLGEVVGEVCSLMQDEVARRRARIELQVDVDAPAVAVDRIQIQQAFSNLIRNALDAMDGATGEKIIGLRVRRIDAAVQVEISDTGPGVEHPDRVFQPFYTTKNAGMGMGLAICRSIVAFPRRTLGVEENQRRGAKFVFDLPLQAAETQ